jgi:hypothetical protein
MKVKMLSEQEIVHEALEILLNNLTPSKMARLLATWPKPNECSDYLTFKDQLFKGETIETLYTQIKAFEKATKY